MISILQDIGVCRWAKLSHLQYTVYETGSQVGNICSRSGESTVDYIMVRQKDKTKIRNVKVITSDECVPKHKLLVMDMRFKATKRRRRKFEPRVRVRKLKEEKT